MKPLRWFLVLVLLQSIALLSGAWASDKSASPADVTQGLYHSAFAHFGFNPRAVKASRPWLTPDLYSRLWKKVKQPVPNGDAPDIEGDVFLNCQDPPATFAIGKATIDETQAKVDVTLSWTGTPGEKRHLTALLKQINGAWKVDDIDYGKDGKLSDLLK